MPPGPSASTLAAVTDLVAQTGPRCGSTLVVAVDGRSGAGKTTFVEALLGALTDAVLPTSAPSRRPQLLHLDDLYPGWAGLARGVRRLHDQVLQPLSRGERAAYRRFDWLEGRDGETVTLPPMGLLVVEGAGCSVPPCAALESVRVWLDAAEDTRRSRGLARDGESYRPHWDRWARQEESLFARHRPRDHADLVLDTT
jgi:uridine kinase